ncbi:Peroxidase 10 [Linum grandiflorum]
MGYTNFLAFTTSLLLITLSTLLHQVTPFPSASYSSPSSSSSAGPLDYSYYDQSCPRLSMIVRYGVWNAINNESRIAASLLRLHFHDCFVNGCEGSILLDDTVAFKGEKNAPANRGSARGFEVIENIKSDVEKACPGTVSCTDILALAAREAVVLTGGPYWPVPLGRRDTLTTSQAAVAQQLPSPIESLDDITAKFNSKGLDIKDVVVLSGAHTLGFAQCFLIKRRLFNFKESGKPDPALDSSALTSLQGKCPNRNESNSNLVQLDSTTTRFDNMYYTNLVNNAGLLDSDQALLVNPTTGDMVRSYSSNQYLFYSDFKASMIKLGGVGVLTGKDGEIRRKCGSVN